ncbi:MAG TPA: hypothetical protein VFG42_25695 [Baekduia sp.]|uniref:hypothetical protein n=1 Tax=Baekduia sp. TaxID=2600305 RepID=UPI002D7708E4|nr:hypothetical protein [Baekduia sp.]HET6510212.1 hypothetical protein [Baekduia sp.]
MRRALAIVCVVLGCVLPAVAVGSWWAYGNATDTDRFMRTATPLASDATVQNAVVDELVSVASARLESAGLPGGTEAYRARIRQAARALVATEAYKRVWLRVQRTAHGQLANRLTGDVPTPLTLDLAPLAAELRARVRAAGLGVVADAIADPAPVVILDRSEVRDAHDAVARVRIVRGIAIPGAVLALLGVLLTAGGLARGLVRLGVCVGVSALLLLGALAVGRGALDDAGTDGALRVAVWDVLTDPLHNWIVGGAIAAVALVALGAAVSAFSRRPAL